MLKWLRNKFPRKRKPAPVKVQPIINYKFGLDLTYWRNQPDRVEYMRDLVRNPFFQEAMSVLQTECPIDSIDSVRGYRMAVRVIELMATRPPESIPEIESSFGAETDTSAIAGDV